MLTRFLKPLLFASLVALAPQFSLAATDNYTDTTTGGLWTTAANWQSGVPVAGTAVVFSSTAYTNTVYLGTGSDAAASILFNTGTTTLLSGTPGSAATLTLTGGISTATTVSGTSTVGDTTNSQSVNVILNGSQTFTAFTGTTLVIANGVTGSSTAETLTLASTGTGVITMDGAIADGTAPLSVTLSSSGVYNLAGANTFTGTLASTSSGTVNITGANAAKIVSLSSTTVVNFNAGASFNEAAITNGSSATATVSGTNALTGTTSYAVTSNGTTNVTGSENYSGATAINTSTGKIVVSGASGALTGTSGVSVLSAGTFTDGDTATSVSNRINTAATLTVGDGGTFAFDRSTGGTATQTLSALVISPGTSTVSTTGTTASTSALIFNGSNSYQRTSGGFVSLNPGSLTGAAINFSTAPTGTSNINDNALMGAVLAGNDFVTLGTGGIVQAPTYTTNAFTAGGTGFSTFTSSQTLSAASLSTYGFTFSGGTTTLTLGGATQVGTGIIVGSGATAATIAPGSTGSLTSAVPGGDLWFYTNGKTLAENAPLVDNSGSVSVSIGGTSTFTLNAAATNTGGFNIGGGTVVIGATGSTGASDAVNLYQGTLTINSGGAVNGSLTGALGTTITNGGTILGGTALTVVSNGVFTNNGTIGTALNPVAVTVNNNGLFTNSASGTINGNVTVNDDASAGTNSFTNNGTIGNLFVAAPPGGAVVPLQGTSVVEGAATIGSGSVNGAITVNGLLIISGTVAPTFTSIGTSNTGVTGTGEIRNTNTSATPIVINLANNTSLFQYDTGAGSSTTLSTPGTVNIFMFGNTGNVASTNTLNGGTFNIEEFGFNGTGDQFGGTLNILNGSVLNLSNTVSWGTGGIGTGQAGSFLHGIYNIGGASSGTLNITGAISEGNGSGSTPAAGATNGLQFTVGNGGTLSATGSLGLGELDAQTGSIQSDFLTVNSGGSASFVGLTIGSTTSQTAVGENNYVNLTGGQLFVNGTLTAGGAGLGQTDSFNWTGGQLTAFTITPSAAFNGSGSSLTSTGLTNTAGILAPGGLGVAGKTVINGTYTQGSSASLAIDVNGTGQATAYTNAGAFYDYLNTTGNVALGGALNVTVGNGYTPATGANLIFLQSAVGTTSLSGNFTSSNLETGKVVGGFNTYYYVGSTDGMSGLDTVYTQGTVAGVGRVALNYYTPGATPNIYAAASGSNWDAATAASWSVFDPGSGVGAGTPSLTTSTGALATFGGNGSSATGTGLNSVTLSSNRDIQGISFNSSGTGPSYSISGTGIITLDNKFAEGTGGFINDSNSAGASNTIANTLEYNGPLTLSETSAGNTLTLSGNITPLSSAAALSASGSGSVVLGGNDSFTTATVGTGTTLQLGSGGTSGSLGSANTSVAVTAASSNFVVDESGTVTQGTNFGTISGNGNFYQIGTGTTILNANNTFGGSAFLNGGITQVTASGMLGSTTSPVTINFGGGELQYSGAVGTTDFSTLFSQAGNQAFNIDVNGLTVNYSGGLVGTGSSLTLQDSTATASTSVGVLNLNASPNYTGPTTVNSGTLFINSGDLSNSSAVTVGTTASPKVAAIVLASGSTGTVGNTSSTTAVTVNNGGSLLFGASTGTNSINTVSAGTSLGGTLGFTNRSTVGTPSSLTSATPLTLQSGTTPIIDFGAGGSIASNNTNTLTFSSLVNLSAATALNIYDYVNSAAGYSSTSTTDNGTASDRLLFTSDPSGGTGAGATFSTISFFSGAGTGFLGTGLEVTDGPQFEIVPSSGAAPEPSTIFAGVCFLALLGYTNRRRLLQQLQIVNL